MKALLLTFLVTTSLLTIAPSFAAAKKGNSSGGGGDATEVRVNEIRSDLLKWIHNGGAKELNLPDELSYGQYYDSMTEILRPKKVVISFTEDKVLVKKVEKTCRGFFQGTNDQPHIRCNISRFKNTPDPEQYKLIHHEYAGLVGVEANLGAASDYIVSEQITDYLVEQKVLRLAVKVKAQEDTTSTCFSIEDSKNLAEAKKNSKYYAHLAEISSQENEKERLWSISFEEQAKTLLLVSKNERCKDEAANIARSKITTQSKIWYDQADKNQDK